MAPGSGHRTDQPRVVVVGPCAAGKSTLAKALCRLGYDAYVCAQEHSVIRSLWRHRNPDIVVFLDVDLATVRLRRGQEWPEAIFVEQMRRLSEARSAADLVIDTATMNIPEMVARTVDFLERAGKRECDQRSTGGRCGQIGAAAPVRDAPEETIGR